jgi:N utilization substance protein B
LGLLYEAEIKHVDPAELLASLPVPPDPFAAGLVLGVARSRERVDALVAGAAVGWELERMAAVDRAVLRLAVHELLDEPEIPVAVVIDEAVELAKQYSTEESGRFVNGVLSTIAAEVRA